MSQTFERGESISNLYAHVSSNGHWLFIGHSCRTAQEMAVHSVRLLTVQYLSLATAASVQLW
jgi:hypothetical protein